MRTPQRRNRVRQALAGVGLLLGLAFLPVPVRAQNPTVEGLFVTVQNPITSDVTNRVRENATRAVERFRAADQDPQQPRAFKLVFDFNPSNQAGSSSDFGACYELSRFILGLQDVTTVAFVHGEASRHTVLPVLACKELVMSAEAKLGPVLKETDGKPTDTQLQAYQEVVKGRNRPAALVLKMLDRDMEVMKGMRNGNPAYEGRKDVETKPGFVLSQPEPVVGRGPGVYTKNQAVEFGLCQLSKESRQEVAEVYQMPANSLREDPLMGRNPVATRFVVTGPVTSGTAESLKRRIRKAVGAADRHTNLVILQLECGGGDTEAALELAKFLRELKDDRDQELPVKTVAYVPEKAPDTAVTLALGCTEIVLRKDATIGSYEQFAGDVAADDLEPEKHNLRLKALMELAHDQGYSPLLVKGMFARGLTLYQGVSKKGNREWRLLTDKELEAEKDRWDARLIKPGGPDGKLLVLDADLAKEVGLAWYVVEGKTPEESLNNLYAKYSIKDRIQDASSDFLDDLAYFLRLPVVSFFLVMLGITCLILEMKLPGTYLPGIVAALCFVIFFWAYFQSAGITMLAVLLFLLGLVLIAVEIFVLPGFGVVGISGVVLVVGSLALVTLDRMPQTTQEWMSFGSTLTMFALSLVGAVVAALTLAWYLPHIPYANRLVLKPPTERGEDGEDPPPQSTHPELAALLGGIGVAVTPLRPAGKVKFGDEFIDVVAEGEYVNPGARVQVIEVEGYRVVVKEV